MKNIILLTIIMVFSGIASAQKKSVANFTVNHWALSVTAVDRSAEFYKTVLELKEIVNRTKMDGIRWFSLGEGKELHLISVIKEPVTINKAVHLALTSQRIDEFVTTLNKMKIVYSDWPGKSE